MPRAPIRDAVSLRRPVAWLVLAALPWAAWLAVELYVLDGAFGFPLDDSFIHLQFARNLAGGEGLAYEPGERVTGSTAPLWTAVLSLGFLLPGDPLAWAKALGLVAHLLAVAATWHLARELDLAPGLALLAAGLTATSGWLVWSALAAMEVPLFCALSLLGMACHVGERRAAGRLPLSLPLLALGVLVRPEGILLLALALLDRLLVFHRDAAGHLRLVRPMWADLGRGLVLAALVLLPALLAYQAIGGSPLPTTFMTKGGYSQPGLPSARYLFEVLGVLMRAQPVATLLAPAGVLALLARAGRREPSPTAPPAPPDAGLLPALWLLALPLAYGVLSGSGRGIFGNFGRYFFPLLPVVAVLAVAALPPLLAAVPRRLTVGRVTIAWPLWLGAALLLPTLAALTSGAQLYAQNVRNVQDGDVRMADLLRELVDPEAVLAVDDIGALGYLLDNRLVDMAGIVSPRVHHHARRAMAATGAYCPGLLAFAAETRPDYLVVFPRRYGCFPADTFPTLLRLEVPHNVTLGEAEIVLRATPWTRYPLRPTAGAAGHAGTAPGAP
jgi:hypothetical protein